MSDCEAFEHASFFFYTLITVLAVTGGVFVAIQALSAFEAIMFEKDAESCQIIAKNARYSLREALAQPEQEELIQFKDGKWSYVRKPWVGLTELERRNMFKDVDWDNEPWGYLAYARAIESRLKELNT